QPEREGGPAADGAADGEVAAHEPREAPADREPEATAVARAGVAGLRLLERREDEVELVGRDADTRVRDAIEDPVATGAQPRLRLRRARRAHLHRDASAGIGELHGVREQVHEDLAHA